MNYKLTNPLVGLLCVSDIKMHFLLAGGSSSSSEELSIVKSITSTFFLLASLATVTEQGLLRTLEPACKEQKEKKKLKGVTQTLVIGVLTVQHVQHNAQPIKPHTLSLGKSPTF